MTKSRPPGHVFNQIGIALLAFSALWAFAAVLTGLPICPSYVTLAQALLIFVAVALAAKGRSLGGKP